jgi:hypothetical protein
MKSVLAMLSMALAALILEEEARQVVGDARDAFGQAVTQAGEARQSVAQKVGRQPWISILIAGGLAYALATIIPARQ